MIDEYILKYGKRLYGLCITLCTNKLDADDLYQETWLKVLKNIDKFDPSKEFEPWLTKICVNIFRNKLRRLLKSPIFDNFLSTEDKDAEFEKCKYKEKEDFTYVRDEVNKLPEKLRITVILFYFEDMEVEGVANILEIPEGTVKSRLNQARKQLREVLKDETDIFL